MALRLEKAKEQTEREKEEEDDEAQKLAAGKVLIKLMKEQQQPESDDEDAVMGEEDDAISNCSLLSFLENELNKELKDTMDTLNSGTYKWSSLQACPNRGRKQLGNYSSTKILVKI